MLSGVKQGYNDFLQSEYGVQAGKFCGGVRDTFLHLCRVEAPVLFGKTVSAFDVVRHSSAAWATKQVVDAGQYFAGTSEVRSELAAAALEKTDWKGFAALAVGTATVTYVAYRALKSLHASLTKPASTN